MLPDSVELEEHCAELGALLGLDGPVAHAVVLRAGSDPDYARNLMLCRDNPMLRGVLLEQAQAAPAPAEVPGSAALAVRAAKALLAWGRTGFGTADETMLAERLAACTACPDLRSAPDRLAYKLAGKALRDGVCGLCGCLVARKARMLDERCPSGAAPDRPGYNRWGQPLAG